MDITPQTGTLADVVARVDALAGMATRNRGVCDQSSTWTADQGYWAGYADCANRVGRDIMAAMDAEAERERRLSEAHDEDVITEYEADVPLEDLAVGLDCTREAVLETIARAVRVRARDRVR